MGKNGTANQNEDMELPIFSLSTIVTATDNFSFNKKLGEGGFGPVYKVYFQYMSISTVNISETVI